MDVSLSQGNGHVHPYQEIYTALTSFRMQKAWEAWVYCPHLKTKLPFLLTRWHGLARTWTLFLEIQNWLLWQRTAECNDSKSVWRSQSHPEDQKAPFLFNAIHRYGTEDSLGSGACPSDLNLCVFFVQSHLGGSSHRDDYIHGTAAAKASHRIVAGLQMLKNKYGPVALS